MKRISRRGFTLVELLVVIGIIAVLISILLPTINKARRSAKTTAGLSNLRQIGNGLRLYATSWKDSLPYGYIEIDLNGDGVADDASYWYHHVNNIFNSRTGTSLATTKPGEYSKIFLDPNASFDARRLTYSAHGRAMPDTYEIPAGLENYVKPFKMAKCPTDSILVCDGNQLPGGGWEGDAFPLLENMDLIYTGYSNLDPNDPEFNDYVASVCWYRGDPEPTNPRFGHSFPIQPGANNDTFTDPSFSDARYRQRNRKPGFKAAPGTPHAEYGYAEGAINALFGDGHCETINHKDIRRYMMMYKR